MWIKSLWDSNLWNEALGYSLSQKMWACRGEETSLSPHCSHQEELIHWKLFLPVSAKISTPVEWNGSTEKGKWEVPWRTSLMPPQLFGAPPLSSCWGITLSPSRGLRPLPPLTRASSLFGPLLKFAPSIGSQHPMTGWCQGPKWLATLPPSGQLWLAILASRLPRDQWVGCCDLHCGSSPMVWGAASLTGASPKTFCT